MQELAQKHGMVMVVPIYEEEMTGVYYNTAAVIDADGKYLGKYRKNHIPHVAPGFWEKFYFKPGQPRLSGVPDRVTRRSASTSATTATFPEGARCLGLNGAEIVFNPSATVAGLSRVPVEARAAGARGRERLLRRRDQPRRAPRKPWSIGEFYGAVYFFDPRGRCWPRRAQDKDELVVADLDLDMIDEVRDTWQFFRDRRPETYGDMVAP